MKYNKLTPEEKRVIANEQLMFTSSMSPPDADLNTMGCRDIYTRLL